jgi:hypothetical protein
MDDEHILPFSDEELEDVDGRQMLVAEAERVLAALSDLIEGASSESIRAILEDACFLIADLIPESSRIDDEDDEEEDEPLAA